MVGVGSESLKVLETKAVAAEKLIEILRKQIGEIKAAQVSKEPMVLLLLSCSLALLLSCSLALLLSCSRSRL